MHHCTTGDTGSRRTTVRGAAERDGGGEGRRGGAERMGGRGTVVVVAASGWLFGVL